MVDFTKTFMTAARLTEGWRASSSSPPPQPPPHPASEAFNQQWSWEHWAQGHCCILQLVFQVICVDFTSCSDMLSKTTIIRKQIKPLHKHQLHITCNEWIILTTFNLYFPPFQIDLRSKKKRLLPKNECNNREPQTFLSHTRFSVWVDNVEQRSARS